MLKPFHWLLLQSERREDQLGVSGLPDLAAVGAGNVWNRSPAPTFPPYSESFISRTVSGWELGIGGGIMCSPCSLEVGVCSPHAVLYFIFLAPVHRFHRGKTAQAQFSHSHKDF